VWVTSPVTASLQAVDWTLIHRLAKQGAAPDPHSFGILSSEPAGRLSPAPQSVTFYSHGHPNYTLPAIRVVHLTGPTHLRCNVNSRARLPTLCLDAAHASLGWLLNTSWPRWKYRHETEILDLVSRQDDLPVEGCIPRTRPAAKRIDLGLGGSS
jgi:hypothetical protein